MTSQDPTPSDGFDDPVPSVPFASLPGDEGDDPSAAAPASPVGLPAAPYALRPRFRQLLLGFLVHHNPFYLLSALCMIAGCYTLNAGLELRSGEVGRVLMLVGTLAAYELMLVGLGLFLIRGRGLVRDGRTLLLLQAVFLADLTFLNAETVTADLRVGLAVNAALLVLAWAKVGAALWVLAPRAVGATSVGATPPGASPTSAAPAGRVLFPWRGFAMAALVLLVLFALPCAYRLVERDGRVGGGTFHLTWWVVGLLPVACEVLRFAGRGGVPATDGSAGALADRAAVPSFFACGRPRIGPVY
ncbi:MAG: hypothetical protein JWO31_4183, partial [Phycisphaerales bacterium]|nr:hypothetical protein [Phycisphaerales bacterium]